MFDMCITVLVSVWVLSRLPSVLYTRTHVLFHTFPHQPGCISKFVDDISEIVSKVAETTESRGMLIDAVRLYDLAQVGVCIQISYVYCL